MFPNLRVWLVTKIESKTEGNVDVAIKRPVTSQCLFLHLLRIPIRGSAKSPSGPPRALAVGNISLDIEGSLIGSESIRTPHGDRSRLLPFFVPEFCPGFSLQCPQLARNRITSEGMIDLAKTRSYIDSFFELLKLAGYASSSNDSESVSAFVGKCWLWSVHLPILQQIVSDDQAQIPSKPLLKHCHTVSEGRRGKSRRPAPRPPARRLKSDGRRCHARHDPSFSVFLRQTP
jgi:hypothetical protein